MLQLKPHQIEAVEFALNAKYSICSVDMGGGKTAIGLEVHKRLNGRTLAVIPAFLKRNWQNEIEKWVGKDAKIDIITYSSLSKLEKFDYDLILADESHYIKNFDAKRSKLFHRLVNTCRPSHLVMLTGTPILNRIPEFWSQLQVCYYGNNYPQFKPFYQLYYKFCHRFCYERTFEINNIPIVRFEGHRRTDELKELIKPIFFRRKSSDFLELTESEDIIVRGKKAPKKVIEDLKQALSDNDVDLSDPAYASLKRANAMANTDTTIKMAKEMIEGGIRPVIFTDHVDSCVKIAEALKVRPITGSVPPEARGYYVEDFEAKKTKAIVSTTKCLSVGFNLVSTNYMLFNDIPVVPGDLDQCKARIRRIGQTKPCYYYFITNSEFDEKLIDMIKRKSRDIRSVI